MTSAWAPLHNHSHFSLLDGVSKPKQIAKRCVELGYNAVSMTDHGNVGCAVQFLAAMTEVCVCGHQKGEHGDKGCKGCQCQGFHKYELKPILGCELYICEGDPANKDKDTNWDLAHLPVLAKNLDGWKALIKITSFCHHKDHFYRFPRIDLKNLGEMANGNLISFSGHLGSDLANVLFTDPKKAYNQTDLASATACLKEKPERRRDLFELAEKYIQTFGKDNFYLEVQVLDPENCPASVIVARTMLWLGRQMGLSCVATADSHYPTRADAPDQRVLLCAAMKTTQKEMLRKIETGEAPFRSNFMGDHFHIPSVEEIRQWHLKALNFIDEESIVNAVNIASRCESYDIRHAPILPTFPCPNGLGSDSYLTRLCERGWSRHITEKVDEDKHPEYVERVQRELNVIKEAGLASYFLIVQDYCNWARRQGMIVGPGRGSGAGCLVSYLVGITAVDPINYGLLFERFYNAGRNAPGHISLPDIDCDFPVSRRKEVVAYLKSKYGADKVANIATFNSMKGRGALTDVLRAHNVSYDEIKRITVNIPEEARISEELQAMKERGEEPSIIRYALENDPDSYKDWCVLTEDGQFEGDYGSYFAQAIRLEGTKRNISTHAAGVVLASSPLAEMCPLIYDDEIDGYIAGMEYPDLEAQGQVKLDILGVASLDKIQGVRSLLRYGYIDAEDAI